VVGVGDPVAQVAERARHLSRAQWRSIAVRLGLSPREDQIVRCLFDSKNERTIALELGISHHTVHTHVKRLYRKLDVTDRAGLLAEILSAFLSLESRRKKHSSGGAGIPRDAHRALYPNKVTPG